MGKRTNLAVSVMRKRISGKPFFDEFRDDDRHESDLKRSV